MDAMGEERSSSVTEKKPKSRILRFDQVYDTRTSSTKLEKTVKRRDVIYAKRYSQRKPVLIVRRIIDYKGKYTNTEIDIVSKLVSDTLKEINKDIEDLSLDKTPPMVEPQTLFHSLGGLRDALQRTRASAEPDEDLIEDLKIACQFTEDEYAETLTNCSSLLEAGKITWDLLWILMKPNSLIYHYHGLSEQHQLLKFKSIKKLTNGLRESKWKLNCDIIADDGNRFGIAREPLPLQIEEFEGTRNITDLPAYPLERHPSAEKVKAEALRRGRLFQKMTKLYLCETEGVGLSETTNDALKTSNFKVRSYGRAMIDPAAFRMFNPNVKFIPTVSRTLERESLTDEQLLITSPVALGFCFGNKHWLGLPMSRLLPIRWNPLAFDKLVLNDNSKKLILSLVKHHGSKYHDFDDIIANKGRGTICLLSGPPGCGKTLTAEAVAEVTQRALYSVSAGELGTNVDEVDAKLTGILELARTWNALLLLDEADVFLLSRNDGDIVRNALVSVFLRQIEYYQGILMLTTNRTDQFDVAFESRIHVNIRYPELDKDARKKVWNTNLEAARKSSQNAGFSDQEKDTLAAREVNGRQIKNVVYGALALAMEEGKPLNMSHIESVLNVLQSGKDEQQIDAFDRPRRIASAELDLLI
ncbi:P-loop containing nucleoside triphosphate hydrolase protein [Hypoxylon sp. FL1284]|nr:P-loop containing nucleoside triphosphate hydrolase protein [Hypoxylon sp. FL1284]